MAINQQDILDQHTVDLQRFATELLKTKLYPTLDEARKAAQLILMDYEQITGITELNAITSAIKKSVTPLFEQSAEEITQELADMAVDESDFYAKLMQNFTAASMAVPPADMLERFINRSLMSFKSSRNEVFNFAEYLSEYADDQVKMIFNTVRTGWDENQTIQQISRQLRVIGDGIQKRDAETLARTSVNHFSNQARVYTAKYNPAVDREIPIVTFDNRVSKTCLSIGSQYGLTGWPVGSSPVGYPPYHPNCRTYIGHLVKGQESLQGTRSATGGQSGKEAKESFEKRQDRTDKKVKYRGKRDMTIFKPGQIPANTNVEKWLASQPKWFIEDTLGPTQAELFIKGGLPLKRFTDMTGRPLTVKQLRQRNEYLFAELGL